MFAAPTASRGKNNKALAKGGGAERNQPVDGPRARVPDADKKRQAQRATKAQRKAGGLRRGGDYEVEELGELYVEPGRRRREEEDDDEEEESSSDSSGHAKRKPPKKEAVPSKGKKSAAVTAKGDSEESEEEEEEESEESEEEEEKSKPPTKASGSRFAPASRTSAPVSSGKDENDDEEVKDIKEGVRRQLRGWAADPGMPLEEQKRCVRQLMAQWHPDKNQHIRSVATKVFQFIQEEVARIVGELSFAADQVLRKEVEAGERKAQRAAERSAKAAALESARVEKQQRKQGRAAGAQASDQGTGVKAQAADAEPSGPNPEEEWSLVIGHGPATTSYLRPWPRSHLSLTPSPLQSREGEVLLFGGEAYDGRELTFFSDLYRLDLRGVQEIRQEDPERPLPWEKLYSAVPLIPGPEARSSHQAVAFDGFLYVFGGEWSSRDQRRFRQFNDFWRFDVSGRPGTRWERVEAEGAPAPRSGHRMAASSGGHVVLFGGFTEDKRRKATYLDDLYLLQLPGRAWRAVAPGRDKRSRPAARAGGLLWVAGGAAYVFGGSRPLKKGGDQVGALEDLWRARLEHNGDGGAPGAKWEQLEVHGQGPGRRSGLCHCAVAPDSPGRRVVFGGVEDLRVAPGAAAVKGKAATAEVAVFHQDVHLLDCEAPGGPTWFRLWPPPGTGPSRALGAADLPPSLLAEGGGVDVQVLAIRAKSGGKSAPLPTAPRGRMAASCVVVGGALWVFGGVCESGPRQEVTLDDLWRLPLPDAADTAASCRWECVLPLSDRATVWFDDSDSDEDEDEEEEEEVPTGRNGRQQLAVPSNHAGTLSKKQQKEEDKKARMELKKQRQQEKCEEKTSKRDQKKERQRAQAKEAR